MVTLRPQFRLRLHPFAALRDAIGAATIAARIFIKLVKIIYIKIFFVKFMPSVRIVLREEQYKMKITLKKGSV